MFETRISKSWGIGENILARFFLENLHEDIAGGMLLFLARDKQTGRKLWLKVSDASDAANTSMTAEASLWEGIDHPNLLSPCAQDVEATQSYLAYRWQGELAFQNVAQSSLSSADLVRICVGLLEGVEHLQLLPEPVAHNQIGLNSICLATNNHLPVLTGFHLATCSAGKKALMADRQACLDVIEQICFNTGATDCISGNIQATAKAWVKGEAEVFEELLAEFDREYIRRVTADL